MTAPSTTTNPYPGPRPFTQQEGHLFFGREGELDDLFSLVVAHRILLVYAQSGAGKTSLIQAGLVPKMLSEGFEVLPLARVGGVSPDGVETAMIPNVFSFSTLTAWSGDRTEPHRLLELDLPTWLAKCAPGAQQRQDGLPRIAVFDQFEELFTAHLDHWSERGDFLAQICSAAGADPSLRIVLVMREDFIAQLDPYLDLFPNRLRTRFRLERLGREAGLVAVTEPLKGTGVSFAPGVAKQLVEDLMKERLDTGEGKIRIIPGEYIEPVQLQVVCHGLWSPDVETITADHLTSLGNIDRALSLFYDDAVAASVLLPIADEPAIRTWCETELITTLGTRSTLYRGTGTSKGLPNQVLDTLEARHLVRPEWRAGARWYELSHDRFIDPIRASNREYFARRHLLSQSVAEALALEWRDSKKARSLLEAALASARQMHDLATEALCVYGLARVTETRDSATAHKYYLQALAMFEATTNAEGIESTLQALANLYRTVEDYEREAETYSKLLEARPDWFYLEDRAAAYWYANRLPEALADYDEIISYRGESSSLLSARGQVLVEMGYYERAADELSRAAESSNDRKLTAYARGGLGMALAGLEDFAGALREFESSISLEPDNAWVYFRRAACYERMQDIPAAVADYRRSLEVKNPPLTPHRREEARARIKTLDRA